MFCHKCGNQLVEGAEFCNKCGQSVNAITPDMVLPASVLKRLAHHFIDGFVAMIVSLFLSLLVIFCLGENSILTFFMSFFGYFAYYLLCESLWQKTLGKVITKTKVVDREGKKPSFLKILGRTLARHIPLEQLSFLFSSYPVGWHDSLSKTLVVPKDASPEKVSQMNLAEIKKLKSTNGGVATFIIVIITVLVVIAIIGILSSVVLVSLSSAREKGIDAAVKSYMASLVVEGLVYQEENSTYAGFCESPKSIALLKSSSETVSVSKSTNSFTCFDNASAWAASVALKSEGYWCADSSDNGAHQIASSLNGQTECPAGNTINRESAETWSTYTSEKDGFSVIFPRSPTTDFEDGIPTGEEGRVYGSHSYKSIANTDNLFIVLKFIYSPKLESDDSDDLLKGVLNNLLSSSKSSKLVYSNLMDISGNRTLEYRVENKDEVALGRIIMNNGDIYLVMLSSSPRDYNESVYTRFIDSFKII